MGQDLKPGLLSPGPKGCVLYSKKRRDSHFCYTSREAKTQEAEGNTYSEKVQRERERETMPLREALQGSGQRAGVPVGSQGSTFLARRVSCP